VAEPSGGETGCGYVLTIPSRVTLFRLIAQESMKMMHLEQVRAYE
jgi:hypothetical protein